MADTPDQKTTVILPARRGSKRSAMAREVEKALAAGWPVYMLQPGAEAVRIVGVVDEAPQGLLCKKRKESTIWPPSGHQRRPLRCKAQKD